MHLSTKTTARKIAACQLVAGLVLTAATAVLAQSREKEGFFPKDDLFQPLLADPKEPRFYASVQHIDNDMRKDFTGAAIGIGETFGVFRKNLGPDHAWQLSLNGGLFSHFDMDTASYNLLNSDYQAGLLWTYRYRSASVRLRAYHQSSHLGDDYARENPEMLETHTGFDYEAADLLLAYDWSGFRVYGGFHYLLQRDPYDLDRSAYQGGLEYHGTRQIVYHSVPVCGVDVKGMEERGWTPASTVNAGIIFQSREYSTRDIQILAEYYNGFIPFGPFYEYDMESYGVGIYFGF